MPGFAGVTNIQVNIFQIGIIDTGNDSRAINLEL